MTTRTCLVLARGELTLVPGNPTVRINRHHNITLNLRLRVRVDSREIVELPGRHRGGGLRRAAHTADSLCERISWPHIAIGRNPIEEDKRKGPSSWQHRRTIWRSLRSSVSEGAASMP